MTRIAFLLLVGALVSLAGRSPVSGQDTTTIAAIKAIHAAPSYSRALLESGLVAEDMEWWVMGDPAVLPWAGTWKGSEGVRTFFERLNELMDYDSFTLEEYIVGADNIVAVISAGGTARLTGKRFESGIVRIYSFRDGKIARVRNYYDTAAYTRALRPE